MSLEVWEVVQMMDRQEYDHPCYVISIAAQMVRLHPQTLRNYERAGLIRPGRSSGNVRLYSPRDIERIQRITRLVEDLGVNLAGVEVILRMSQRMQEMRREMEQRQEELEAEIGRLRQELRRHP